MRRLATENAILTADRKALIADQRATATETWLDRTHPDGDFLAAGLVGGIHANSIYPADFITN